MKILQNKVRKNFGIRIIDVLIQEDRGSLSITYRGSFKNNLPHGKGVCKLSDGRRYDGEIVDGKVRGCNENNTKSQFGPHGGSYFRLFREGK